MIIIAILCLGSISFNSDKFSFESRKKSFGKLTSLLYVMFKLGIVKENNDFWLIQHRRKQAACFTKQECFTLNASK